MTNIVTPKQTDFINRLRSERVVSSALLDMIAKVSTTAEASAVITALMNAPRVPRGGVSPELAAMHAALEAAEPAKYAVPAAVATAYGIDPRGDLLFFEVKRYKGRKYINRLTGAPGAFHRSRFSLASATGLLTFIQGRHVEFSLLFGRHFVCCGRCAAPLSDQTSRETGFGPECRSVFGL